jgi:hypothetical protein
MPARTSAGRAVSPREYNLDSLFAPAAAKTMLIIMFGARVCVRVWLACNHVEGNEHSRYIPHTRQAAMLLVFGSLELVVSCGWSSFVTVGASSLTLWMDL